MQTHIRSSWVEITTRGQSSLALMVRLHELELSDCFLLTFLGDTITFYTNRTHANYDTVYMNTNALITWKTFMVRVCGGVNVELYTVEGDSADNIKTLHYTVQLGVSDGTVSKILDGDGKEEGWMSGNIGLPYCHHHVPI